MSIFYRVQSGGGGAAPTIVSKTITSNGTYNASSDSADGYDPVIVNVLSGDITTVLVDWDLYSHISAFDTVSLPANFSDFEYLGLCVIQTNSDQNFYKGMSKEACKQYILNNINAWQILIIPTANISATDTNISIPLMSANGYGSGAATTTDAYINSSRILGYNYPWSWQDLYILVLGFNS